MAIPDLRGQVCKVWLEENMVPVFAGENNIEVVNAQGGEAGDGLAENRCRFSLFGLKEVAISKHFIVNQTQTLKEA